MPRLSKIGAAALAAFGWTSGSSVTASYLVVAGGGAGGNDRSGGGGAGGLLTGTASLNPTLSYTVTVGAGGATSATSLGSGNNGSNSVFNTATAIGGGGGAGTTSINGLAGGSGGGGNTPSGTGGAGTSGQGNAGGAGSTGATGYCSGGGGGAGAVGQAASSPTVAGNGGAGTASSISGSSVTYAGGGGGGGNSGTAGTGGAGGGGNGSVSTNGTAGTANLGGGGGGAVGSAALNGGQGGSGVVIISYLGAQQFGGGNVTSVGGNTIHTFTTSGTLSPLSSLTAQYLIVAGGGTGGGYVSGGGGAGGLLTGTGITIDINSNYVVVVGAGGAAGSSLQGNQGSNSSWSMVSTVAVGGGGGATGGGAAGAASTGGSGGGGAGTTAFLAGAAGTSGQGFAGGTAPGQAVNYPAGGGGGAGAVGVSPANTSSNGGNGGIGVASSISGTSTYYAGGGGGGVGNSATAGTGGTGGGGDGARFNNAGSYLSGGAAGTANTGGGGGGGGPGNVAYGGGSGVVIIAYPGSTQQMAGGTVTISGGNVIHTFTSSGYLTPIKYASRSLRFRSSASAYLNRTTTSSVTNNKIFTYSMWVKRGIINDGSAFETLIGGGPTNADTFGFGASTNTAGDFLHLRDSANGTFNLVTTQLFRDPSSWYHLVLAVDTTQATASNRVKLYVNGVQVTSFSSASYPAQNYVFDWNTASTVCTIGRRSGGNASWYYDGYLTEVNFIDGAALTPSSFGTFNSYGVWQPITYGGSYGTNGFYLTFGNNTSTTTLGYDTSPQGNNWTTNNISVTAGTTYDSMLDVPTLTSSTANNYCVLNPLITDFTNGSGPVVVQNGNLQLYRGSGTGWGMCGSTFGVSSGKWYWEATANNPGVIGIHKTQPTTYFAIVGYNEPNGYGYSSDGTKMNNTTGVSYAATYTTGDVIGMALDMDAGTLTFYKNNTSQGVAFSGLSGTFMPAFSCAGLAYWDANFGQRPFSYTPPSGFVALNTYNLSTPTIPNGAVYMAATTYTGTGAALTVANTVNGTNFQPDWVWVKSRSAATDHKLTDVVRGVTKALISDTTGAETTDTNGLTAFGSTGFTLGTDTVYNNSGATYVAWQWKANGTGVSNTSGTITSTVSANTTAGFSVVTYTGNQTAGATVGHGLGVTPSMFIVKGRTNVDQWCVYTSSTGATGELFLNLTNAFSTDSTTWNNTAPTSNVITLGTSSAVNGNANTYVAYVFAPVAGYSAFGSYTGNGSADGPFVFLGFRPRWVMLKRSSASGQGWQMYDNSRNPYNTETNLLFADGSNAEQAGNAVDVLSNGFKLRSSDTPTNSSGIVYIYMAFAENPFKYSNAR